MIRKAFLTLLTVYPWLLFQTACADKNAQQYDLVVYGGTPAGIMAAVEG